MATTYLSKTLPASDEGAAWTFSTWVKRGILTTTQCIVSAGTLSNNRFQLYFGSADAIGLYITMVGTTATDWETTAKYKDPGAWYNIVLNWNGSAIALYVNGVQVTAGVGTTTGDGSNKLVIGTNIEHKIGALYDGSWDFTGSMAHTHFCAENTYAASSFGEFDATSGIWVPKTGPSVTYGTNGFFLKYQDTTNFGDDSSGNANDFTVAAGTMTQTKDNPSNNFCLPNAISKGSTIVLSNGNTTIAKDSGWLSCMGSFGMDTGKWYWEQKVAAVGNANAGITKSKQNGRSHSSVDATRIMYGSDGNVYNAQGSTTATGTTFTTGDIISVALDCAGDTIKFYKNDVLIHTETETDISDNEWCPAWGMSSGTWDTNFGNGYFATTVVTSAVADGNGEGQFEYAPPSGYLALCTKNLGSDS